LFIWCAVVFSVCFCYMCYVLHVLFFFFQAEDGIRDRNVTGVQTCALPILLCPRSGSHASIPQTRPLFWSGTTSCASDTPNRAPVSGGAAPRRRWPSSHGRAPTGAISRSSRAS